MKSVLDHEQINGVWQHKIKKVRYEATGGIQLKFQGYWYSAVIYRNLRTGAELVRIKEDFLNKFEKVEGVYV